MTTTVVVGAGEVRYVHDDDVTEALAPLGEITVTRASNVEPEHSKEWGLVWVADLRPVGGPRGTFVMRSAALAWEREWLESNGVPTPVR